MVIQVLYDDREGKAMALRSRFERYPWGTPFYPPPYGYPMTAESSTIIKPLCNGVQPLSCRPVTVDWSIPGSNASTQGRHGTKPNRSPIPVLPALFQHRPWSSHPASHLWTRASHMWEVVFVNRVSTADSNGLAPIQIVYIAVIANRKFSFILDLSQSLTFCCALQVYFGVQFAVMM